MQKHALFSQGNDLALFPLGKCTILGKGTVCFKIISIGLGIYALGIAPYACFDDCVKLGLVAGEEYKKCSVSFHKEIISVKLFGEMCYKLYQND